MPIAKPRLTKSIKNRIRGLAPGVHGRIRNALRASSFKYRYIHRPDALIAQAAFAPGESADDERLIGRLMRSYTTRFAETPTDQWLGIFAGFHGDIHEAMISGDSARAAAMLRNPAENDMFYGFDNLSKSLIRSNRIEDQQAARLTLDGLASLAEAMGARRLDHPEGYLRRPQKVATEEVLGQIDAALGFPLRVPNPFPREYGLSSDRGVISYRVPQAVYQAWRISRLVASTDKPKVLEIGGGLGRTAFYAKAFGVLDYTIVDIPISSLAQGYFIGRTLGEAFVRLHGETPGSDDAVKILAPEAFLTGTDRYDLILNADSLTEIGYPAAKAYWTQIERRGGTFLSINHEANETTVGQLIREAGATAASSRMPYWMRRGYVEEVVRFS